MFRPEMPRIHNADCEELARLLDTNVPRDASLETIERILYHIGRFTIAGHAMPGPISKWLATIPAGRLFMVRVTMETIIANAYHMHQKELEAAQFGLVGYIWATELRFSPKEEE